MSRQRRTKGADRYHGRARPRTTKGVYRRCRRGFLGLKACPGYYLGRNGKQLPHGRCGGDGWIKVGSRKTGRAKARGSKRRRKGRARNAVVGGGVMWLLCVALFGSVGTVIFLVVGAVMLVLALLGGVSRLVSR